MFTSSETLLLGIVEKANIQESSPHNVEELADVWAFEIDQVRCVGCCGS
jgi:hypothetical protein